MTARDVKRSALGMGRILPGSSWRSAFPVAGILLVDYTRPTVAGKRILLIRPSTYDETGSFEPIDGRTLKDAFGGRSHVPSTSPAHLI